MEEGFIMPIVIGVIVLVVIVKAVIMVTEQTAYIIERFGRFTEVAHSGQGFIVSFVDRKTAVMNLRVQKLDVTVETKTLDDVFVNLQVSVQYQVGRSTVKEAYYSRDNPKNHWIT